MNDGYGSVTYATAMSHTHLHAALRIYGISALPQIVLQYFELKGLPY